MDNSAVPDSGVPTGGDPDNGDPLTDGTVPADADLDAEDDTE
jgi:hypothetical protein